jgi:hypothetical protein
MICERSEKMEEAAAQEMAFLRLESIIDEKAKNEGGNKAISDGEKGGDKDALG